MTGLAGMTLDERMEYAAKRKKEMNCCQAVLVAFADRLGKSEDCVRNAVLSAGEALKAK
jgi:hypothetical protein